MGNSVACCTSREDPGADVIKSTSGKCLESPRSPRAPCSIQNNGSSNSDVSDVKVPKAVANTPPRKSGAGAEPDAEPDDDLHVHGEFVKSLRLRVAEEEDIEYWQLGDVSGEEGSAPAIRRAAEDMVVYFNEWKGGGHDGFWHRKSNQIVLSVVVCRDKEGVLRSFRGMNTEVSLPGGSLCAERAAIARAASDLRAAGEIVAVAVLDPTDKNNPMWPCEVCQSWLAKLRDQSSAISVLALRSSACQELLVRVNGVLQPRPRAVLVPPESLAKLVQLAEGVTEQPWEARNLVYVDGAWDAPGAEQWALLKAAKAKGTHLLAGIHSDETLRKQLGGEKESFEVRLARLLEDRHVSSVLTDAPWCLTEEHIAGLGIRRVVTESKTPERRKKWCTMSYEVARRQGILEIVSVT